MSDQRNTYLCIPDLPVEPVTWDVVEQQAHNMKRLLGDEVWNALVEVTEHGD